MQRKCEDCRYFELAPQTVLPNQAMGYCRRFPPTVVVHNEYPISRWPFVSGADWCGEWAVRLVVQKS
jgi:hypothetical protein